MASWAAKRRFLYISLALAALLILAAVPVFFLVYKVPTCSDGRQNQGEFGVDCGGPCERLCRLQALQPLVLWSRSFRVGEGVYNALAVIENPNLDRAASGVPYLFRFYDEEGILIAERAGETDIAPAGLLPVFEGAVVVNQRRVVRTTFEFTEDPLWRVSPVARPSIVRAVSTKLASASSSPRLTAVIRNTSLEAIPPFDIVVVLSGADGNAVAVSRTLVDGLPAEGDATVVFSWREPLPPIAKIDLMPRLFAGVHY